MTKVVFETAALADAFKRANIVAPSHGKAFDEAGGIVLEISPEDGLVLVRATNKDVFHTEWVTPISIEGEATSWRLASQLATPIITSLPIGSGKEVTLQEVQSGASSRLEMKAGKTRAKFFLMDMTYYPEWDIFDPNDLVAVPDLGGKLAMVEWAAGLKELPPLSGVNLDGERLRATDRYKMVTVPLEIPNLDRSVTIPAGMLGQLLRQTGDVSIGFTEHQVLLMPTDSSQVRLVTYAGDYPTMARLMNRERPNHVTVKKAELLAIVNRATLASPGDRLPLMHLYIGKQSISAKVDGPETAVLDFLDIPGQAEHERVDIKVTPKLLTDILNNAPNEKVTINYDANEPEKIIYIDGGSGFEAWMVARRADQ